MSLYEKCLRLSDNLGEENKENTAISVKLEDKVDIIGPRKSLEDSKFFYRFQYSTIFRDIYYISDVHLPEHIKKNFPNGATDKEIKEYIVNVVDNMFTEKIIKELSLGYSWLYFIFGGDISSIFEISKLFYTEFMSRLNDLKQKKESVLFSVYSILGNHEYWDFNSVEDCQKTYQDLFDSLGISFLNDTIDYFGEYRGPTKRVDRKLVDITKNDPSYSKEVRKMANIVIVGGTGFAGFNDKFNADNGLYRIAIDRKKEIELTKKWIETYKKAYEIAKNSDCKLIVLTHNPVDDWQGNKNIKSSCVYIFGHTHKNGEYRDESMDTYVIYDNQIGYRKKDIKFKRAYIFALNNPYVELKNGYYETNLDDYLLFNRYVGERIDGTSFIEKALMKENSKMYVIKHNDYYGFFISSKSGISICQGGKTKKINRKGHIGGVYNDFAAMIDTYLVKLTPFRNVQEEISDFVKSFGGTGRIHGCIVDISGLNHIMLNPFDKSLTYYYSPEYGTIQRYESLYGLLADKDKYLLNGYVEKMGVSKNVGIIPFNNKSLEKSYLEVIDIKNSIYAFSNRLEALQRLFDKKVLREWNDDLLNGGDNDLLRLN